MTSIRRKSVKHRPIERLSSEDVDRFWSKIDKRSKDECWPWLDHTDKDGYPPFRVGKYRYKAGRVILFLTTGDDPGVNQACHSCNNPSCCNPSHLYAGTQSDNFQRAIEEKRAFVGQKNGRAKLTEADIVAIRGSSESNRILCERYSISNGHISRIRLQQSWKHIECQSR